MRSSKFWLPAAMRSSAITPSLAALPLTNPAGFIQKPVDESYGQANYVRIRAVNTRDPARGRSLNCVGAGFVHRLFGRGIFGDFVVRHGIEPDCRGGRRESKPPSAAHQTDACDHVMAVAGKSGKHAGGIGGVG